jgi:hypothetical protein
MSDSREKTIQSKKASAIHGAVSLTFAIKQRNLRPVPDM